MSRYKNVTGRRATIKDIATLAKVSIGTVDRVLHQRGEVNAETHERIMSFVEELGYTPNLLAKSLALKKSFVISVLIPGAGLINHYWEKPLEGFIRASGELSDFNTRIDLHYFDLQVESSFVKEFRKILNSKTDGIIMAPNFQKEALRILPECNRRKIPVMFIDNNLEEQGLAYFGQDAYQSGIVSGRLMNYGLRQNDLVIILNLAGSKSAVTHHMQKRELGFSDYFNKSYPERKIKILSSAVDLSGSGEPGKTLNMLLSAHHKISGIFVTNSRVYKVAEFMSEIENDSVILIGYDLVDANREFMEKGTIDYLICQKPEEQAYKSAMAMFDYLLNGRIAERINYSPIDIVVRENINYYLK